MVEQHTPVCGAVGGASVTLSLLGRHQSMMTAAVGHLGFLGGLGLGAGTVLTEKQG